MDFIEEGKRCLGKMSSFILSVMFFMSWFAIDLIEVTGLVLLIGFIGKKLKDFGYNWTDYDWNKKDPFEVELLGYGCVVLMLYLYLFMIFIHWQPIFTLLITGVIADTVRVHFNSWNVIKAKLSFLKT
ncbi:hypothetical protein CDAR_467641 [Caerostris darwini]|uniref:Uncharacterized protein n=1 Tax=Caerostris darwini TaxID=1538125 RepID=A0AAV4SLA1_9ARAC|nr:hypothetical protein CDAR_467641 [Caerostris darwini]